jgi:hypothetical protein
MRRLIADRSSFSKYTARANRMNSASNAAPAPCREFVLDDPQALVDRLQSAVSASMSAAA